MDGYRPSAYGDGFADVYDDWYTDVSDVEACVHALRRLVEEVGGGPVLELGVGTGRLALPLARHGVEVHGIDASRAMLDALAAKPGADRVHLTEGDMAELVLPDPPAFAVVFVAFNTFFNLSDAGRQQQCLQRVSSLLAPGGRFVLEAFVPLDRPPSGPHVSARRVTDAEVVLSVSDVDASAQTVTGQHVQLRDGVVRLRPWHLRYATPVELDAMARRAGLLLDSRAAGWDGEPFTDASGVHVSTYRRGNVRAVRDHAASQR